MRKALLILFGVSVLLAASVWHKWVLAQEEADNPSLSACERYANWQLREQNPSDDAVIRLFSKDILDEKYEDKVGNQFISSVLSGRGVLKTPNQADSAIHFTCLLEDWKTPRFFHMTDYMKDMSEQDPAQTCWDQFQPAGWGELTGCLQQALIREEETLKATEADASHRADQSLEKAAAKDALDVSSDLWQQYRDAECQRQQAQMAGGNHPDVRDLTCRIQVTHERIRDLRFDE
jgi:uncharacterized protein YecT (DUF1311 family)